MQTHLSGISATLHIRWCQKAVESIHAKGVLPWQDVLHQTHSWWTVLPPYSSYYCQRSQVFPKSPSCSWTARAIANRSCSMCCMRASGRWWQVEAMPWRSCPNQNRNSASTSLCHPPLFFWHFIAWASLAWFSSPHLWWSGTKFSCDGNNQSTRRQHPWLQIVFAWQSSPRVRTYSQQLALNAEAPEWLELFGYQSTDCWTAWLWQKHATCQPLFKQGSYMSTFIQDFLAWMRISKMPFLASLIQLRITWASSFFWMAWGHWKDVCLQYCLCETALWQCYCSLCIIIWNFCPPPARWTNSPLHVQNPNAKPP